MQLIELTCHGCGAPVEIIAETSVCICPYCNSKLVIASDSKATTRTTLKGIPFSTQSDQFQNALLDWLSDGDMTPDNILEQACNIDFNGTYVPFWAINGKYEANASCKVGHEHVEKTMKVVKDESGKIIDHKEERDVSIRWTPTNLSRHGTYNCFLLGSKRFDSRVQNFLLSQASNRTDYSPFEESSVKGHILAKHDIPHEKAFEKEGETAVNAQITAHFKKDNSAYDHFKVVSVSFKSTEQTEAKIFYPFWVATFQYKNETYPVAFNGIDLSQSTGVRPEDPERIKRFEEIDAPFKKARLFTIIGAIIGLFLGVFPGVLIAIGGGIYCYKLHKERVEKKNEVLNKSYEYRKQIRNKYKG